MSPEHWPGDAGDVDAALAYGSGRPAPTLRAAITAARNRRYSRMLDGCYPTDPAQYTAMAGPAA